MTICMPVLFLQPQQIEHLPCADEPDLIDDHDAVAIEPIAAGLDAFEEGRDRGALGDAGRPEIGRLAPGQGDAEHLAPVGFPGLDQRRQGGALAGAGDADRDTQPAAGGELASSSRAAPAIAPRPDRSPGCARGRCLPRGRSVPSAKRPTNRARRSWPAGSIRAPGRYAMPLSHSSAPCRAGTRPCPTAMPPAGRPAPRRARERLFITASMSSPGRSPMPATIKARAAISRNSWPSNTARRLSSASSNGNAAW